MKPLLWAGLLSFALVQGAPQSARADFIDGNTLYGWCTTPESDPLYLRQDSSCRTYILGVHDGLELAGHIVTMGRDEQLGEAGSPPADKDDKIRFLCVTADASVPRMRELVVAFIEAYPEKRKEPGSASVIGALYPHYPCVPAAAVGDTPQP